MTRLPPGLSPVNGALAYVELAAASNFSFLRGASHAEELVVQASRLGLAGIAITDRNSLAGVVRGHMAAKESGLAFAPGCRLVFMDATPDILVWPEDRTGYGHLCELLTTGKRRAPKGECHLMLEDLLTHGAGLLMAVIPPGGLAGLDPVLADQLTERERALLALLAEGLSDKAIARRLNLSPTTVRTYNSTLYAKLGVQGRGVQFLGRVGCEIHQISVVDLVE